jgi:hypothetical protein
LFEGASDGTMQLVLVKMRSESKNNNLPLTRCRQSSQPDSNTRLLRELLTLLVGEVWVPCNIRSHC